MTPLLLGTVLRVQVQRSPLKPRPAGSGRYDPAPLREVEALEVGPDGCTGLRAAERLVDVHHAAHPQSRHARGVNGLSVLPRAHYARLRERYGGHLVDGVAGENVLLDTTGALSAEDLRGPLLLEADGEALEVTGSMAAPPCVEFSRFVLGREDLDVDDEVRATLADLDHGARGFYLRVAGTGVVRPGARLLRAQA